MKVVIMRGASGAGKSTYIKNNFPDAVVCSADHFFINEKGEYIYNKDLISKAHEACMRKFLHCVQSYPTSLPVELIVVDNTNIRFAELSPYALVAKVCGYEVEVIRLCENVNVAAERNTHNVPLKVVKDMAKGMENLPWYVNETIVHSFDGAYYHLTREEHKAHGCNW